MGDVLILDPIIPVGDPALCWALDPRNGAKDLSGNGRDGTAGGGITLGGLTDAPLGWNGATDFDGSDDRIQSAYAAFTGARTFMGWAKRDTHGTLDTLFGGDGVSGGPLLQLAIASGSTGGDVVFYADRAFSPVTWAGAWTGDGLWTHVALVAVLGDDLVSLYINGKLISTLAETDNFPGDSGNFKLGARLQTNVDPFDGKLAMWSVYERALTAGEVASDYERGAGALHKRVELDLSPWVAQEGLDWGDAAIARAKAEGEEIESRKITVPLRLADEGAVTFEQIRNDLQAKAGIMGREGGTIRRGDITDPLFADVLAATLTIPDSWFSEHRGAEPEGTVLVLDAEPDFYGHEEDKGRVTGSAGQTIHTSTDPNGDAPGRMRAIIENLSTKAQRSLLYAIRSRYRGDGTDAMVYEAEALTPLGGAVTAALSGASGGGNNVVQHTNLPGASWLAILEGKFAHVGPHRVWARLRDPAAAPVVPQVEVHLRLEWFSGNAGQPTQNPIVAAKPGGKLGLVDLGLITPRQARVGSQTWIGRVLAKADAAGADIQIDKLYILPTGEGYGKIIASNRLPAPSAFSARDEFNQSAGALAGKALPDGSGSWTGAGDADDFTVNATDDLAERTAANDVDATLGRFALAPPTGLTDTAVEVDVKQKGVVAENNPWSGVVARYVDANNWLIGLFVRTENPGAFGTFAYIFKRVAGTLSTPQVAQVRPTVETDTWDTIRLMVLASGEYAMWVYRGEAIGEPLFFDRDTDLATGGALASGKAGFYDLNTGANALLIRQYDNFAAWVPTLDAVLHPSRSTELGSNGYWRRSADGSASAPIPILGDNPQMPASGKEGRDIELLVKMSEGDLGELPDGGLDAPGVRVLHRPSWLFPRR